MKSLPPLHLAPRSFRARSLVPLMMVGVAAALVACGPSADAPSSAKSTSSKADAKAKATGSRVTIKGDGVNIDATASAALMRGFSAQPLTIRILAGWVDTDKIALANKESDPAEKKKKAMGAFGTITINISAGKVEPGTYQLGPDGKNPQGGTVVIEEKKDAGLAGEYTSKSGTLTIKSVTHDGNNLTAIDGLYDGQFASKAGDSRAFSGEFRITPKKK